MDTNSVFPLLVMFGLDYTLWPYHAHHSLAPYNKTRNGVFDYEGKNMTYYPEVPTIFAKLHTKGIKIAVGTIGLDARNSQRLLELFELDQYISYRHLYLVNYEVMFERIREESNIQFSDMLFYDDFEYNIKLMNDVGVFSVQVPNGLTLQAFEDGLKQYEKHKLTEKEKS